MNLYVFEGKNNSETEREAEKKGIERKAKQKKYFVFNCDQILILLIFPFSVLVYNTFAVTLTLGRPKPKLPVIK